MAYQDKGVTAYVAAAVAYVYTLICLKVTVWPFEMNS